MMTDRDKRMARHIADLAKAFNVDLVVRPDMSPDKAGAGFHRSTGQKLIRIAPVTEETTYIVAMHELGHCLSPMGQLREEMSLTMRTMNQLSSTRDVALQLEEERAAWEWAQHYALEWTAAMQSVKTMCLGAYERRARSLITLGYRRRRKP